MGNRRTFTAAFKTERVLEVLTGAFTPAEVCRRHQLSPQQLAAWKADFLANAPLVFQRDRESEVLAERVHELERVVGRLTFELDAAKKVSRFLSQPLDRNGRS
jgi:transposase-like protein